MKSVISLKVKPGRQISLCVFQAVGSIPLPRCVWNTPRYDSEKSWHVSWQAFALLTGSPVTFWHGSIQGGLVWFSEQAMALCFKKLWWEKQPRPFTAWQACSHPESGHLDKDLSLVSTPSSHFAFSGAFLTFISVSDVYFCLWWVFVAVWAFISFWGVGDAL